MIIGKKLDWLIFNLVHLRLIISFQIKIKKKTEVIIEVFDQVARIVKILVTNINAIKIKKQDQ